MARVIHKQKIKRTIKPHQCVNCNRTIQPGEPAKRVIAKGSDIGGFRYGYACQDCDPHTEEE